MRIRMTLQLVSFGRITIPEAIRKKLNLNDGDLVEITLEKFGEELKEDINIEE